MKQLFGFRLDLVIVILSFYHVDGLGQTCCSGGVRIASNLGMPLESANIFQLTVTYDLNVLKTLKTGTEVLDDRNRRRTTHSALVQGGYSFSRRFSFDALFSYVRQERNVNNFGSDEFTHTDGIGDATFLVKYLVMDKERFQLTLGLGAKAPIGSSTKTSDKGIALNADLQPGSGAWDAIGWLSVAHSPAKHPSTGYYSNVILALKGHNKEYLGVQDYTFGTEFQFVLGWGDKVFFINQIFDPGISLRYRHAARDEVDFETVPSTGGEWIFVNPSLSWWLNQNVSWNVNVELPLTAKVTGTQVTPTFRLNTGFYYKFPRKQDIISDYEKDSF